MKAFIPDFRGQIAGCATLPQPSRPPCNSALDRPTDLTFGPDGNLYVISRSSAGPREVLRFDGTTGAFIDTFVPAGRGGLGDAGCLLFASGVGTGPRVNISGVTIQNGVATGISLFKGSTLSLNRSIVTGNRAFQSAGIFNEGTLNVTASTITRNVASGTGGGGMTNSGGIVKIDQSTIDNNSANGGGGTGGGGIENSRGTLMITNSTISNNTVTDGRPPSGGGGIDNRGGAIQLKNVTIANNSVLAEADRERLGGGILNRFGGTVPLINTIFVGNSAPIGPDCFGC